MIDTCFFKTRFLKTRFLKTCFFHTQAELRKIQGEYRVGAHPYFAHPYLGIVGWILFLCFLFLCMVLPSIGHASEVEGPPKCAEKYCKGKKVGKIVAPIARILVVDALMYGGLVIIWPDSFAPSAGSSEQFAEAWTGPPRFDSSQTMFRTDGDPWPINAILHPMYGSEAYLAARTWGHNPALSFLFALGASFTWEYLIESWFQRPSLIDLTWTPFMGAALGEIRYLLLQVARKKISPKVPRVIVMNLLDPLGQLERALLGCEY